MIQRSWVQTTVWSNLDWVILPTEVSVHSRVHRDDNRILGQKLTMNGNRIRDFV